MSRRPRISGTMSAGLGPSNAELRDQLVSIGAISDPAIVHSSGSFSIHDGDRLDATIVSNETGPQSLYLSIENGCGDLCDIVLSAGRIRALAAFLAEHFPNA